MISSVLLTRPTARLLYLYIQTANELCSSCAQAACKDYPDRHGEEAPPSFLRFNGRVWLIVISNYSTVLSFSTQFCATTATIKGIRANRVATGGTELRLESLSLRLRSPRACSRPGRLWRWRGCHGRRFVVCSRSRGKLLRRVCFTFQVLQLGLAVFDVSIQFYNTRTDP